MLASLQDALTEQSKGLKPGKPKTRPMYSNMFGEAKELQALVLNDARKKSIKPFVRAQLVRAYKELAELRLRLQGKGPPKAVDYGEAKRKRSAPAKGFTETPAEQKGKPAGKPAVKPAVKPEPGPETG